MTLRPSRQRWSASSEAARITVCADPDRLPYSAEKPNPAGFDIDVSREIAKELGFKLAYTWHSTHRGTKIVRQLAEAGCDFFPGFPVEAHSKKTISR